MQDQIDAVHVADLCQSKLDTAAKLKEEGNTAFKAGDLTAAMRAYHQIALYLNGIDSSANSVMGMGPAAATKLTPDQATQRDELMISHHLNLAAVYIKLEKWEKGVAACTSALAINTAAPNVKALFRRGKCRSELGDIDGAKEDLERVAAANPEEGMVKRELRLLQQKFREHEKKERAQFGGMFG